MAKQAGLNGIPDVVKGRITVDRDRLEITIVNPTLNGGQRYLAPVKATVN
jgi:hypothetical protein